MKPNPSTGLADRSSTAALAAQAEQPATTATEIQAEKPPKPYKPEPITAERIKDAENVILHKVVNCDVGTEVDHLLDPTYWTHTAAMLQRRAHIEAYGHDGTWMAHLLVVGCDRLWARVKLLGYYDLTDGVSAPVDESISEPYYAKWLGDQDLWGVVRRSDQRKMEGDIATRDQAQTKAKQMAISLK